MANGAQHVNRSACDLRVLSTKIWGWLQVMQITIQRTRPAWPAKTKLWMTLDCSRIVKEITMVGETSVEQGRHCFILASDKNKKDQKKSSKQTSRWLPHIVISQRKIWNAQGIPVKPESNVFVDTYHHYYMSIAIWIFHTSIWFRKDLFSQIFNFRIFHNLERRKIKDLGN